MQLEKTMFYCTYTRNTDEPAKVSLPFPTLEAARDEAAALKPSGYWGVIEQTVEPLFDEQRGSLRDLEVVEDF
jgi:hypothetical protein